MRKTKKNSDEPIDFKTKHTKKQKNNNKTMDTLNTYEQCNNIQA